MSHPKVEVDTYVQIFPAAFCILPLRLTLVAVRSPSRNRFEGLFKSITSGFWQLPLQMRLTFLPLGLIGTLVLAFVLYLPTPVIEQGRNRVETNLDRLVDVLQRAPAVQHGNAEGIQALLDWVQAGYNAEYLVVLNANQERVAAVGRSLSRFRERAEGLPSYLDGQVLHTRIPFEAPTGASYTLHAGVSMAWVYQSARRLQLAIGILFALIMIAGLVVIGYLTYRTVRPMEELISVARRFADGDLSEFTFREGTPEVRDLARALRVLGKRVQDALHTQGQLIASLRAQEDTLHFEIREKQRYAMALREAKEVAEQSATTSSLMVDTLNHEIRTPITIITSAAEVLRTDPKVPVDEFADIIQKGAHRLLKTMDAVLELSQLDAGRTKVSPTPCDVRQLLHVAHHYAMSRAEAHHRVTLSADTNARVLADAPMVSRIMRNLVDNAVKFTPSGEIGVAFFEQEGRMGLCVRDTGIGFTIADPDDVFKPFWQASSGLSRDYEGCGLGLTLAERYASLMGGTLAVESRSGEGSTFTLWLPKAPGRDEPREYVAHRVLVMGTELEHADALRADIPAPHEVLVSTLSGALRLLRSHTFTVVIVMDCKDARIAQWVKHVSAGQLQPHLVALADEEWIERVEAAGAYDVVVPASASAEALTSLLRRLTAP